MTKPEDTDMTLVSFCWSRTLQPSEPGTRSGSIDVEAVKAKLFSNRYGIRSLWSCCLGGMLSDSSPSHSDVEDIFSQPVDAKESSCQVG